MVLETALAFFLLENCSFFPFHCTKPTTQKQALMKSTFHQYILTERERSHPKLQLLKGYNWKGWTSKTYKSTFY